MRDRLVSRSRQVQIMLRDLAFGLPRRRLAVRKSKGFVRIAHLTLCCRMLSLRRYARRRQSRLTAQHRNSAQAAHLAARAAPDTRFTSVSVGRRDTRIACEPISTAIFRQAWPAGPSRLALSLACLKNAIPWGLQRCGVWRLAAAVLSRCRGPAAAAQRRP